VEFIEDSYDLSWYRTGVSQATAGRPYGFMPDILGLPARNVGAVFDRPPGSGKGNWEMSRRTTAGRPYGFIPDI
jgi:hypothetical protein